MAKRCGIKNGKSICQKPRANWWKASMGIDWYGSSGSTSFDIDYHAVLDRATILGYTQPSESQKVKQNAFVLALKAAGIWALLDVLYVYATDGGSDFATLNWKSPSLFQATKVGGPTFTANVGFTGTATPGYIDLNWNPANGVNFTQNNCAAVWCATIALNGQEGGNSGSSGIILREFGATDRGGLNNAETGIATNWVTSGVNAVYMIDRISASDFRVSTNAGGKTTTSTASSARSTQDIFNCARNVGGVTVADTGSTVNAFMAGGSFDNAVFHPIWTTYFTSL